MKEVIEINSTEESERVYKALHDYYKEELKSALKKYGASALARKLNVDRSSILKPLERDSFVGMRNIVLKIQSM